MARAARFETRGSSFFSFFNIHMSWAKLGQVVVLFRISSIQWYICCPGWSFHKRCSGFTGEKSAVSIAKCTLRAKDFSCADSGVGYVTALTEQRGDNVRIEYILVALFRRSINGSFAVRARSLRSDVFPSTALCYPGYATCSFPHFDSACLVCSNYINMQFSF